MDDEEDECLLLYSKVSLLADFNGVFSGLNFVAFGLANFAETHAWSKWCFVLFYHAKHSSNSSNAIFHLADISP